VGVAAACSNLGIVTVGAGRPHEAEAWINRALDTPTLPATDIAAYRNNLANVLMNEVRGGGMPGERLPEARDHAERALAIVETLDASEEIWETLMILAEIANMEGKIEVSRGYRQRERETFAAFAGNRHYINVKLGKLISAIAIASQGNEQARAAVVSVLPRAQADGWLITTAVHRIWAGERDWHTLVDGIDRKSALLVLRVLETIAENSSKKS
jgi:hypothetical protein